MEAKSMGTVIPLNPSTRSESGSGDPLNLENPVVLLRIYRHFTRVWLSVLTPSETHLLNFILDGTIGWKRLTWQFSYRYMESGDNLTNGTGLSSRQLMRVVKQLEDRGIIAVDREDTRRGLTVTLNPEVMPEEAMLSVPKRLKNTDQDAAHKSRKDANWLESHDNSALGGDISVTTPLTDMSPLPCQIRHPIKEQSFLEHSSTEQETRSPGKPDDATWVEENLFPEVVTRHRQRPLPRTEERTPPVAPAPLTSEDWNDPKPVVIEPHRSILKPVAIERTFRRAFEIENEGISGAMFVKCTKVEYGMLRQNILDRWEGTPEECHEMFEWCVREWFTLRKKLFSWMEKRGSAGAPSVPSIRFICDQRARIIPAFFGRQQLQRIDSIDDREERRMSQLILEGKSREEALLVVAEERAKASMREENAKAKDEARHAHRTALIAEQQLRDRQRFGLHNPHPSSQLAQQMKREQEQANAAPEHSGEPLPTIEQMINAPFRED